MNFLKTILIVASSGFLIEAFYGGKFMEYKFVIEIGMSCSLIKISDCKSCTASIYDEVLPIKIYIAKQLECILALMTDTCQNVQIKDL